ncbi:hypothetical protein F5050DRAFT_1795092 [Lentinula boryana]|uniref:Uncharacterized protein n=1 Tax=Lentinula boryana TaxID=40481 RepID=A0ABQ8PXV8_9AGAR|nr:hypothetical protein F5050DRAFT_1795092 [Lentinula boryana]
MAPSAPIFVLMSPEQPSNMAHQSQSSTMQCEVKQRNSELRTTSIYNVVPAPPGISILILHATELFFVRVKYSNIRGSFRIRFRTVETQKMCIGSRVVWIVNFIVVDIVLLQQAMIVEMSV